MRHTVEPGHISKGLVYEKCKDENIIIYEFKLTFLPRVNQKFQLSQTGSTEEKTKTSIPLFI